MPSTYSSNLKIELMSTGENSGTWGNITNTNLGTALEQAVVGYGAVSYASDANLTISITNSNAAQAARALVLNVTSALSLTATRELVVPTIEKQYIVQNNTTGSQSITVKTSAGTGITVPNGRKAHLYVDGTNVIQMFDFVDINGGTIDGTPIGGSSAAAGAFTTLNASGATTLDGNVALGNASGDLITFPGTINSHLLFTDNTYDIGANGATRPRNLFLAGAATIGGNLSVGGTLTLTGGVNLNGNVTVGDNASDTLTINSTITSNLLFTDNTYDIGASGATRPRNLFLAGNATIGGNQTLTGSLTVDSTTDSSSTITGSIQTDGGMGVAKALYVGTTLNVAGAATMSGAVTLGDAAADNITVNGTVTSNLIFTDNTYDIGASGATRPRNLYLAGLLTMGGALTVNGNTTLGDAAADTVTVNGTITSNLIFTDNTYDIGASGATRPRDLFLGRGLTVGTYASIGTTLGVGGDTTMSGNQAFNNNAAIGNTAKFIGGSAYGGAIRFAANGASATDRGLQLGVRDNSGTFTQVVSIDGDSLFVATRGGVISNSTALQMSNNSTTLSQNNFFTISNRGTDTTQTGSYTIGGVLFAGYRDVRTPANVAAIYADRINSAGGLSSLGRLYLTTGEGSNIPQDGSLPSTGVAGLDENGNWFVGTAFGSARLTVNNNATGAINLGSFTSANGTAFQIASSAGSGQYMATSVSGDAVLRETAYSLCFGTNNAIKFGNTVSEFGRFNSSAEFLLGTSIASGNRLIVNGTVRSFQQGLRNELAYEIDNTNGAVSWAQPNLVGHYWTGTQDAISLRVPSSGDSTTASYDIFGDGTHIWYYAGGSNNSGSTASELGRWNTSGQFLVNTSAVGDGGKVQVAGSTSGAFVGLTINNQNNNSSGQSARLVLRNSAYNGGGIEDDKFGYIEYKAVANYSEQGDLRFGVNNGYGVAPTDVGGVKYWGAIQANNGYFVDSNDYAVNIRALPTGNTTYANSTVWYNRTDFSADPSFCYVMLCDAYQGGAAQSKSFFQGDIIITRGSGSAGNITSAVRVYMASAYLSDAYGGVNYGGVSMDIVSFTYSGSKRLGVRFTVSTSSADVQIIGPQAASFVPGVVADGSVSSVSVLMTMGVNP